MIKMGYDDFDELPFGLKSLTLILYIISVPLLILVGFNLLMLKIGIATPSLGWIISNVAFVLLSLFSYLSAIAINHMKLWAPTFFYSGCSLIFLGLVGAQYFNMKLFNFTEINIFFLAQIMGILGLFVLIIESNRKVFTC
jgi:hypothetical protein